MNILSFCIILLLITSTLCQDKPYNNTQCVTFENLRYSNYTTMIEKYNSEMVFSDNYCYGIISYNITQDAFANIIQLNYKAFQRYRSYLNLFYLYNITSKGGLVSMNDGCLPIYRHIACFSVFNACVDNGNNTFTENEICQTHCSDYKIRCDLHFIQGICDKNSTADYCAGKESSKYISPKIALISMLVVMLFF